VSSARRGARRSTAARTALAALIVLSVVAPLPGVTRTLLAQTGTTAEGAPDFLLPIGGRSLAMGQAAVASAVGSEAIWWNPALIARGPREVALLASKIVTTQTDASAAVVIPVQDVGAFALSVRYLNYGEEQASDSLGQTGTFVNTSTIVAATFAAPFGDRLAAGVSFKLLLIGFDCTGQCGTPTNTPRTFAFDLGGQYFLTKDSLFAVGAALRNLGPKLQITDTPQADPLPARLDVGVAYAPKLPSLPKEARVRAAADIVSRVSSSGGPGYRLGVELSWMERYAARAGYVVNGPTGSGGTFGFGFSTGKLAIDFAQMLSSEAAQSGSSPTYLTLRYLF
jgi:hypothetical protein